MSVLETILVKDIEGIFDKLIDGFSKRLIECKGLVKEDIAILLTILCKRGDERMVVKDDDDDDDDDVVLCKLLKQLLHGLIHDKQNGEKSSFDLSCKCIAVCMKSNLKSAEILNSFLKMNIQSYITKLKNSDLSFEEEYDECLIIECSARKRIPFSSLFQLLFELSKDDVCNLQKQKEYQANILNDDIFNLLLQVLAVGGADDAIIAILSQIIKMHLKVTAQKTKILFDKLFEISCQGCGNNVAYGMACLVIDEFLTGDEYDIRNEVNLKWFVQKGLTSDDLLTRKRAMYIIKRIVDVSGKIFKQWSKLNDFILLFEALEEKQLHVMLPILPSVSKIVDSSNCTVLGDDALDFSWLTTILIRALNHDNRFITRWAVDIILQLNVKNFQFFQDKKWYFIIKPLFEAFKEYYLFEKETGLDVSQPPNIVTELSAFLLRCKNATSESHQQIEFFKKVIESLCSNGYNAVTFPYIAQALSTFPFPGVVDSKLLSLIKTWMLSETSTFPAELKMASFHLLLKIVTNCMSKDEITLVEFIKFAKVIYEHGYLTPGSELWCQFISKLQKNVFSWKLENGVVPRIENFESFNEICHSAVVEFLNGNNKVFERTEEVGLIMLVTIDLSMKNEKETSTELVERILNPVLETLTKFGRNPYISEEQVQRAVSLVNFLLIGCIESKKHSHKNLSFLNILDKLLGMVKPIFSMYRTILHMGCNEESMNFDLTKLCYNLNSLIFNYIPSTPELTTSHGQLIIEHVEFLLKFCSHHLNDIAAGNGKQKHAYLIFKSLEMICNMLNGKSNEFIRNARLQFANIFLEIIININLDFSIFLPKPNDRKEKDALEVTSFDVGDITKSLWSLVSFAVSKDEIQSAIASRANVDNKHPGSLLSHPDNLPLTLSTCSVSDLVNIILETIDVSVGTDMIPLLQCLASLMPNIVTSPLNLSVGVLKSVWRLLKEQERRDSRFWKIFTPCVNVLFHKSVMLSANTELLDMVTEFWRFLEDVGQKKSGLLNVVVGHCCAILEEWFVERSNVMNKPNCSTKEQCNSMLWCINLLVDACTFGHVQKKAARIMQQVIKYFNAQQLNAKKVSKNVNIDYQVRWIVVKMLLKIDDKSEQSYVAEEVMKRLIEKDRKISEQVKRYYDNSITHRQKLRIWQTMLTLNKFVNEGNAMEILSGALSVMVSENQPSIRYYIEWFVVIIISKMPSFKSIIWEKLSEASERRVCSVTCLMSIIMHVAVVLPDGEFSEMAAEAFAKILPWVQIHHMQARVHAQIVIWKLWDELKFRGCDHVLQEYQIIESLFTLNETNASVFKAREEIRNHFYFKTFHPIEHFSLETIFCSMPKLLNVGDDELLDDNQLIEMLGNKDDFYGKKVLNKGQSLFDLVTKMGHRSEKRVTEMETKTTVAEDCSKGNDNNITLDVQKKIVAWKPLPPSEDPFLQKADTYKKEMRRSELVLCASLIDRTPNLGGLCRTCEIFGVSSLVIGAMRYLDDSNFKSLSVTAEKWINVEQVLPRHLEVYLKEMKAKGYRLVGIEQTANSKALQDYKFQEKTLLLLGNEREGIPVELIQILDDCVEIPQQGVIRSLNVHVSGAIIVWEYFKQKLLGQR